jgi:hypothetical protein
MSSAVNAIADPLQETVFQDLDADDNDDVEEVTTEGQFFFFFVLFFGTS